MTRGVKIGLSNVVYAKLIEDPEPGQGIAVYDTPKPVRGAITANINPNSSTETLFADNGPYDTATTIGQITLELNLADIPLDIQADWLGATMSGGVLINKADDVPPWIALGFKSLKSNGKYRYVWLAKGKFSLPEDNNETRTESIAFQTPTIQGSFVKRDCDDEWRRMIDEDHLDYIPSMGQGWFNSPYGGSADTTPPQVSAVVPADGATGVALNATVRWTFDEPLALSTVTKGNFLLFATNTGVPVQGSLTINSARTEVTLTPSGNLESSTDYTALVTEGVKDVAGNEMVTAHVTTFTTQ